MITFAKSFFAFLLVIGSAHSLCKSVWADECSWQIVAQSQVILKGRLKLPLEKFQNDAKTRSHKFLPIEFDVLTVLKGDKIPQHIEIMYQAKGRSDAPTPSRIRSLHNTEAIVFLEINDWPGHEGYYFTGAPPECAARPFNPQTESNLIEELRSQEKILASFNPKQMKPNFSAEVDEAIADFQRRDRATSAYSRLIAAGPDIAPAIVLRLENFTELPVKRLNISQDAKYQIVMSPKLVVDALAIILEKITKVSFGNIGNGGSARKRFAVIQGWKIWLAKQSASNNL